MGAELGATTSIFPSDEATKKFLEAQGRGDVWVPLSSDPDAEYDEEYTVDLSALEPLAAAMPHMPDNVKKVSEIGEIPVNQCCIGSCTNSSYYDMMKVASILKGKTVSPEVSLTISPGSKQVFNMLAQNGALADIISAGARILECACGPCIGMGQSPESGGVSLRTFNRNFEGRSGTQDAQIFLVSPEVAAASALTGVLTDPRTLGEMPEIEMPEHFTHQRQHDRKAGRENPAEVEVVRGPNISPSRWARRSRHPTPARSFSRPRITSPPTTSCRPAQSCCRIARTCRTTPTTALSTSIRVSVPLQGAGRRRNCRRRKLRSGARPVSMQHSFPLYLGVKAVLCKSFARIHKANLVNSGIIPLTFADPADYDANQSAR